MEITCYMGSHSVTCHAIVNVTHLSTPVRIINCWWHKLIVSGLAESSESREKKRRRRSRWGSDAPQQSPASGPPSLPGQSLPGQSLPGQALPGQSLPGQSPVGFVPAGMSGYPPPGAPVGMRPPGMMMSPQLGAAAMPRPNMPGSGSKSLSIFKCSFLMFCCHCRP